MARFLPYIHSHPNNEQSAFIKGRNINDNIMFIQEIAHSMSSQKRNKSIILIKIDKKPSTRWVGRLSLMFSPAPLNGSTGYSGALALLPFRGAQSHWFTSSLSPVMIMQICSALLNDRVSRSKITWKNGHTTFLMLCLRMTSLWLLGPTLKALWIYRRFWLNLTLSSSSSLTRFSYLLNTPAFF